MKRKQLLIPSLLLSLGLNAQTVVLSEDFSSATPTNAPAGWNNADLGTSGLVWKFNPFPPLPALITAPAAVFDSFLAWPTTPPENAVLESPAFNASLPGSFVLEFDHEFYQDAFANATYSIEAWNGTSWNVVLSSNKHAGGGRHVVLDITAAVGNSPNAKLRFHWMGTDDWHWIVDNVIVTRYNCVIPANLTASNITTSAFDLSWTGGTATNWNVEYGPSGFNPGTGTLVTVSGTPALSLDGFNNGTHYDVYFQSDCGGG